MSLINRMFGGGGESMPSDWHELTELGQLETIKAESNEKPVVIFKHSVTCGISAGAKYQLESDWDFNPTDFKFYYLDLLAHRPVSNKIAEEFGVVHQSPQVIVIKNGQAVADTSHHAIRKSKLAAMLQEG